MAGPGPARLPATIAPALGAAGGAALAWALADLALYPLWAALGALALFALGWSLSTDAPGKPVQLCRAMLHGASALLLVSLWSEGPSGLALFTAFWALQLFTEWRPALPVAGRAPGAEFQSKMADLSPALWAFFVVMLPLRLGVVAPWTCSASPPL